MEIRKIGNLYAIVNVRNGMTLQGQTYDNLPSARVALARLAKG